MDTKIGLIFNLLSIVGVLGGTLAALIIASKTNADYRKMMTPKVDVAARYVRSVGGLMVVEGTTLENVPKNVLTGERQLEIKITNMATVPVTIVGISSESGLKDGRMVIFSHRHLPKLLKEGEFVIEYFHKYGDFSELKTITVTDSLNRSWPLNKTSLTVLEIQANIHK